MNDKNDPHDKLTHPYHPHLVPLEQNGATLDNRYTGYPGAPGYPPYYPKYQNTDEEQRLDLRELWHKVWRRKWLILAIVLIATTFASIEASRSKSIYRATTTIEIGRDTQGLTKLEEYFFSYDDSDIKTGLFLLRSRPLLEDVVANLRLHDNPAFLEVTQRRSIWDVLQGNNGETAAANEKKSTAFAGMNEWPEISSTRAQEESDKLAPFVGILMGSMATEHLKETRLIGISITHTNPQLAAAIANGVARVFIERTFNKKTEKFTKASDWLSRSTRQLQANQQQAEQELADYSRRNNIFTTEGKEDLTTNKLASLHDQMVRAETERMLKESLYEQVQQGRVAQLPEAFANSSTSQLQQKLTELTVQAAQLNTRFGAKNPRVIELREQAAAIQTEIENSRKTLAEKLKADYERALRDENSLKTALNHAKSEAVQQNQTAIQYGILRQRVETAKAIYNDFLQKTSQADISRAEQQRHISIAEPAQVPGGPIGPLRFRTILFAFVLSLAAGIGLAFLLDHLDNTIKSVDDVTRYVRVPTLGVIPAIDAAAQRMTPARNAQLPTGQGSKVVSLQRQPQAQDIKALTPIMEAYRMLRTSVLLAAAGRPPKTILVTSSRPSEGKTTTSVNTAISLAQLGARVLIIDADMRRPRVHKTFAMRANPGLSNYLANDIPIHALVRATTIPNLWVLNAGLIPPNSAELLSSERMRALLLQLAADFDHVLIDSPPVGSVADPIILSRLVDGVILVVHSGQSTRDMVRHTRQELLNVGAKIFGVVLNNVNIHDGGYYNYYRYQYGYEQKEAKGGAAQSQTG